MTPDSRQLSSCHLEAAALPAKWTRPLNDGTAPEDMDHEAWIGLCHYMVTHNREVDNDFIPKLMAHLTEFGTAEEQRAEVRELYRYGQNGQLKN